MIYELKEIVRILKIRRHDWSTCFSFQCMRFISFLSIKWFIFTFMFSLQQRQVSIHEVNLFIHAEECFSSQFCLTDSTPIAHAGSIRTLLLLLTNERREKDCHTRETECVWQAMSANNGTGSVLRLLKIGIMRKMLDAV